MRGLDCLSEPQVSERIGVPQQTVSGWLAENRKLPVFGNAPDSRQHFDVWPFAADGTDSGHFGKMPPPSELGSVGGLGPISNLPETFRNVQRSPARLRG